MTLDVFLNWLEKNNISLRNGISIAETPEGGISVRSNCDEPILHPQTVASIPKSSILSVRSCSLRKHIPWAPYGHGAVLSLSLALYSEMLKGAGSRWYPYLQSLPSTPVPIARLWGDPRAFPDDADSEEAARWIQGTEIQRELQDEDGSPLRDEAYAFHKSEVQPLLDSMDLNASLHGFLHAYSLVCSRAFLVDTFHGLSMVPVADAFNHAHENHVQLASEFHVCPVCGSLSECPHDREDVPTQDADTPSSDSPSSDTVDMVTVRSIPPRAEIFNTYGADLGNASLLARYGFALEGGEMDVVTFGWPGSGIILDDDHDQRVFRAVCARAEEEVGTILGQSALIYTQGEEERNVRPLTINSDAQASVGLFVWAVWTAVSEGPHPELEGATDSETLPVLLPFLRRVATVLVQLESLREMADGAEEFEIPDDLACQLLEGTTEALASLCRTRIAGMGKKDYRGASAEVLGDVLDNLPLQYRKSRLALEYLLSERALLEACAAGWEETRACLSGNSIGGNDSDMEP